MRRAVIIILRDEELILAASDLNSDPHSDWDLNWSPSSPFHSFLFSF